MSPLEIAIENLYKAFALYRESNFEDCDYPVSPEVTARLSKPVRDLAYEDLERYAAKAMTTWGDTRHFKHFLPRLLELTIKHRDEFLDLAVVFGKLSYAEWNSWPRREKEAVRHFLDEYWLYQLTDPVVDIRSTAIDTVLCALSNACRSVQPFLDTWLLTDTCNAKRHLAVFILNNDDWLLRKGHFSNPFWDVASDPHRQVLTWLQTDELLAYVKGMTDAELADNFSIAWPQLIAIRAALENMPT